MKATGIVRRIDDLGRIFIPKEIRRKFNISEGDPLEIFTTDEGITLVPYRADNSIAAKQWLKEHKGDLAKYSAKFIMQEHGHVICEAIASNMRVLGEARCDPRDEFDIHIGMVIAFCRAINRPVPAEFE